MQTIDQNGLDMLFKAALNYGLSAKDFETEIQPYIITIKKGDHYFKMENLMNSKGRISYKALGEGYNDFETTFHTAYSGLRNFQKWCQDLMIIDQQQNRDKV